MFNLLANSVSIKNVAEKLDRYEKNLTMEGRGPLIAGEMAKIFRLITDFESKNTMGYDGSNAISLLPAKKKLR